VTSPPSRHGQWLATTRFPSIDGLRCLSIVPVVWHHSTSGPEAGILGRGPLGVDLFFVISGFLITTLLLRERETNGRVAVGAFYLRRVFRIFPLYYAVLGAYVIGFAVAGAFGAKFDPATRSHFFRSLPFYATYTTNWLVDFDVAHPVAFSFSWSLAVEEQFYLVWPWTLRAPIAPRASAALVALLLAASPEIFPAAHHFAPIGLGALSALALRTPLGFRALDAMLGHRWSAPLALAAVIFAAWWPLSVRGAHLTMVALVVACSLRDDHFLAPLLTWRPVRHVGIVSYGMYLLNVPVVFGLKRVVHGAPLVFAVGLPCTVLAATATYYVIERPFMGLRARFRRVPA
jgi:peptidoglycan/LPS O-acetylase OafA/YrhL